MSRSGALLLAALAAATAGGSREGADRPSKPAAPTVAWHQLGKWSGRGNLQTESFTSDTGTLRVRWETTAETPDGVSTGGAFRLTAHSAISGRPLQEVVDQTGVGSGIGYVQQDPHVFYVVVDSSDMNWTFTVEEGIGYP